MDNVKNFEGMTALITGASSGIGAASATAFGARGARVLIHYNRQESEAQRINERVRGAGGQAELLRANLTTMDGVRSLVRALAGRRIDIPKEKPRGLAPGFVLRKWRGRASQGAGVNETLPRFSQTKPG